MDMNIFLISWKWDLLSTSLVVLICIFIAVIIFSIFINFFFRSIDKNHNSNIAFNSEKRRIFTLDVDASKISYFDKQDMRNQAEMSLKTFYRGFEKKQAERVRRWIYSFTEGDGSESAFLSMRSKINSTGKDCIDLFHITSYNREKRILHFEKVTLPGVSTKSNRRSNKDYLKSIDQVQYLIKTNKKYRHQALAIYIKLNHKRGKVDENKNDESYTYYSIYQPLIAIYRYLNKRRFLSHIDDMNACIFDFELTQPADINALCEKIIKKIERYFCLKAMPTLYTVSIGCAFVKNFDAPLSRTIAIAERLAYQASSLEGDSNFIVEGTYKKVLEKKVTKKEIVDVESLISNRTFRCYFTPVLSTRDGEDLFILTIKPYGIDIEDYRELTAAADEQGLLEELFLASFQTIGEAIGKDDYKFIFKTEFKRIPSIVESLKELPDIKKKLYLLLDLSEIQDISEGGSDVNGYLDALEKANIKIAINYDDVDLDAPKGVLSRCDLFLIVVKSEGLHSDERTKSELIAFKAVLQDYQKPIVVDKMLSLADILFAKDLGYDSFVCESIAGSSSSPYIPEESLKEDIEKSDKAIVPKKDEKDSSEEVVKEE